MSGNTELIRAIGNRFIERRDVKAVQGEGIAWQPVKEKFTLKDFEDHLSGTRSFGHYLVSPEGNAKFFAFDIDLNKTGHWYTQEAGPGEYTECNPREVWLDENHPGQWCLRYELRIIAESLVAKIDRLTSLPVAVASSGGKGLHVYGFCGSRPASAVRYLAKMVMDEMSSWEPTKGGNFFQHKDGVYPNITIEVFPKQDEVGPDGFGNLMALPLGVHRGVNPPRSRHFCRFNVPIEQGWTVMDPLRALEGDSPWQ